MFGMSAAEEFACGQEVHRYWSLCARRSLYNCIQQLQQFFLSESLSLRPPQDVEVETPYFTLAGRAGRDGLGDSRPQLFLLL